MMLFKLDIISTIIVLLIAPFGGRQVIKAELPKPVSPFPVIKMIAPMAPIHAETLPQIDYQPFPLSPMGTYSNTYTPRNCTWGVASMKASVPGSWGNANTWDDMARLAGITVSQVPIAGSIAQTDHGYYGHVAAVLSVDGSRVQIEEMNFDYNGGVRTRWANVSDFVYIYI